MSRVKFLIEQYDGKKQIQNHQVKIYAGIHAQTTTWSFID